MTTTATPIANEIIKSLHLCVKRFQGQFKSNKQRSFLVNSLNEAALAIRTLAEQNADGDWVPYAREYTVVDDREVTWAFTCYRQTGQGAITRRKVAFELPTATEDEPVVDDEPVVVGPVIDPEIRAELAEILKWGPSEYVFTAPSAGAIEVLAEIAKLDPEELSLSRTRRTDDNWEANDLNHITQVQIAAKGLLCEIGDNAGTSPVSMSVADAQYISQMITEGHIRNAHWFKRATMVEKRIRRATVVNKAKMDPATAALAQRMVDLMNASAARLGRPVTFEEYVEIMTA